MPPPFPVAVLPLTMTFERVSVPPAFSKPPPFWALPPLIVKPESVAEPPAMLNTWLLPPPLTVTSLAPGPVIVVIALSVSESGPEVRVIVCGALAKTAGSKRDRVAAGLRIGEVNRLAKGELSETRTDAIRRGVDLRRRLALERADVD